MIYLKYLIDFTAALILVIALAPLFIFLYVLIRIDLGKSPFFTQARPGFNEKIFKIYKFKTMKDTRDKSGNLLPDKDRMTKIGKAIRSLSLDELPQLINVLKGELSLVGPRPLLVQYLPLYTEREKLRHSVKPGITGWAQVNGRNNLKWKQKFELDIWYVENWSLFLDLKILFLTVYKVLKRSDIQQSENVTMTPYDGSN